MKNLIALKAFGGGGRKASLTRFYRGSICILNSSLIRIRYVKISFKNNTISPHEFYRKNYLLVNKMDRF